jgi:hypothetical protein
MSFTRLADWFHIRSRSGCGSLLLNNLPPVIDAAEIPNKEVVAASHANDDPMKFMTKEVCTAPK